MDKKIIKPEIEINNFNFWYGKKKDEKNRALKNIDLEIPKNKITVLMGPSGCGKTTLLKSINRLHDMKDYISIEGGIEVSGEDIYHPEHPVYNLRKKVGLISQKPFPLPGSIYSNVAFGPKIHKRLNDKELEVFIEVCLKKVNLWDEVKDRLSAPAVDLSKGQQQRLCIARALAINPEVLLCDEITSSLDPVSSNKIERLLIRLKENYTIVLVSHILRQVKRIADYVAFIYLGEVIEAGYMKKIFENPKEKLTRDYITGSIS